MANWDFIENKSSKGNTLNYIFRYHPAKKELWIEGRGLTREEAIIDALQIALKEKHPYGNT